MEDLVARYIANLVGRASGPMHLRLFLQPLMALIFAARAGVRDARSGRAPYLWAMFTSGSARPLLREGWQHVGRVFLAACVMDVVYQIITVRWIYPGETLTVAFVLAFIPYVVFRGLFTRVARHPGPPVEHPEKHAA